MLQRRTKEAEVGLQKEPLSFIHQGLVPLLHALTRWNCGNDVKPHLPGKSRLTCNIIQGYIILLVHKMRIQGRNISISEYQVRKFGN